ncbi:MAG: tetratricopeptide repeat protein [Acidobacteria bacterium]|nr:tetratricopeptide repeat protein [Acidobacteriota bacterium]
MAKEPPPCWTPSRRRFSELVQSEEGLPLAEAALLIAAEEYPDLEISRYLRRLDHMALQIRRHVGESREPGRMIQQLNHHLFALEGFRGNEERYFDPKNSFLNEVLDRKVGIPITLSVVYMEVAQRLDFALLGVGFPGHFLVKYASPGLEIVIDPFHQGALLTEEDCQRRLDQLYGGSVRLQPVFLSAVTKKQILTRMLTNLKGIYMHARDYARALGIVEMILLLDPRSPQEVRDRGLLYYQLECYSWALHDLQAYLTLAPQAEDQAEARQYIQVIRELMTRMN